jgi:membrane protein YdbS with pleckstrin-like domain
MATDRVVFTVRPVFIGWITLLLQAPLQLFFTIWAAGFLGGLTQSFLPFLRGSGSTFAFFGACAFLGIPAVAYFGKKLNYGRTEYRFFTDRLEFEEGFFSINKKVIMFRDVKEVTLRKGLLQRFYNLGTIYLATLATGSGRSYSPFVALGFGNVSGSGIMVRDIPDPDQTFEQIRELVDARRE